MSKYIDVDALKEAINKRFNSSAVIAAEHNFYDFPTFMEDMVDEMPAADVEPVRRWISVNERLPEIEQDVLVAFDDGFVATACIEKDGDWGLWQDSGEVTHWQPLPEPPKMDGGNKKNGEN